MSDLPSVAAPAATPAAAPAPPSTPTVAPMDGGDSGDFWRAADHVGELHLAVCSGETTEQPHPRTGDPQIVPVVDVMICWDASGRASRYDDARVYGTVIRRQFERSADGSAPRPLQAATLRLEKTQSGNEAYLWDTPPDETLAAVQQWCEQHVTTDADGRLSVTWYPDPADADADDPFSDPL